MKARVRRPSVTAQVRARQALEVRLAEMCLRWAPTLRASGGTRAQLLCPGSLVDRDLAEDLAHAWAAISHAGHHQPYDLPPTADELRGSCDTVEGSSTQAEQAHRAGEARWRRGTGARYPQAEYVPRRDTTVAM
jgi:hypothetical protein